jgi:hypothetical protein
VVGAWDEARGEPAPVIEAVVSTIVNRARSRGISVCDAVMDPAALTGVTPAMHEVFSEAASPHGAVTPQPHTEHDRSQLAAVEAAARAAIAGTLADRSNGATHFFSPSGMRELGLEAAPRWAASMVETAKVGPFVFLRERGLPKPPQSHVAALEPELAPVPARTRPQEPVEPEAAAPETPVVDVAAIEPLTFAPLPFAHLQPLPIRPAAPPVEIGAVVLDPGSYLDINKAGTGPRFSIAGEASAAELPQQPATGTPEADAAAASTRAQSETAQADPSPEAASETRAVEAAPTRIIPPAPAPPHHSEIAQNDWAQPQPPQAWAPIQPVAEYVPPPPRIPAFGYFSPETGTWLFCRGEGTRAILVQRRGRRLWRPVWSGVRCGM